MAGISHFQRLQAQEPCLPIAAVCWGGIILLCPRTISSFLSLPTSTPILWQELLDSTFSWYHGSSVFPLMPSQDEKEDEDEDEEHTTEKVKRKTPEEGSRPPPDLARYDIIKVEGTLHSHP